MSLCALLLASPAFSAQYFAELDENKVVKRVIVADQEFINSGKLGNSSDFVETFIDGNYAGMGDQYDPTLKGFIPKKPFEGWILDTKTFQWVSPIPRPKKVKGFIHVWNNATLQWDMIDEKTK